VPLLVTLSNSYTPYFKDTLPHAVSYCSVHRTLAVGVISVNVSCGDNANIHWVKMT